VCSWKAGMAEVDLGMEEAGGGERRTESEPETIWCRPRPCPSLLRMIGSLQMPGSAVILQPRYWSLSACLCRCVLSFALGVCQRKGVGVCGVIWAQMISVRACVRVCLCVSSVHIHLLARMNACRLTETARHTFGAVQYAMSEAYGGHRKGPGVAGNGAETVAGVREIGEEEGLAKERGTMQVWINSSDIEAFVTYQEARMIMRSCCQRFCISCLRACVRVWGLAAYVPVVFLSSDGPYLPFSRLLERLSTSSDKPDADLSSDQVEANGAEEVGGGEKEKHLQLDIGTLRVTVVNDCAGYNQVCAQICACLFISDHFRECHKHKLCELKIVYVSLLIGASAISSVLPPFLFLSPAPLPFLAAHTHAQTHTQPFVAISLLEVHAVHIACLPGEQHERQQHSSQLLETCTLVRARMEASVFNQKILQFEPVVEKWGVTFEMTKARRDMDDRSSPPNVAPNCAAAHSAGQGVVGEDGSECGWVESISLESHEILNVNLIEQHMNTVCTTLLAWYTDMETSMSNADVHASHSPHETNPVSRTGAASGGGGRENLGKKASKFSAYRISNECGLGIRVSSQLCSTGAEGTGEGGVREHGGANGSEPHEKLDCEREGLAVRRFQHVRPMDTQPVCFIDGAWPRFSKKRGKAVENAELKLPTRQLSLLVAVGKEGSVRDLGEKDWADRHELQEIGSANCQECDFAVDMQLAGAKVFTLPDGARVLAEVDKDEVAMSTKVTIRSPVSLDNQCDMPLQVMIRCEADAVIIFEGVVPPQSSLALPPNVAVEEGEHEVSVRPLDMFDDDGGSDADVEEKIHRTWEGWAGLGSGGGNARHESCQMGGVAGWMEGQNDWRFTKEEEVVHAWSHGALLVPGLDQVLSSPIKFSEKFFGNGDFPGSPSLCSSSEAGGPWTPKTTPGAMLASEQSSAWQEGGEREKGCKDTTPGEASSVEQSSCFIRTVAKFKDIGGRVSERFDMRRELKKMTSSVLALGRSGTGDVAERPIDESGHTVDSETSVNKLTLVTISFLPVLMVRNLLPCTLTLSFLLEGDEGPSPAYQAESGERVAVHEFGLSRKVSMGLAIAGLEEGSEFVPVFCPDGSLLESHVTLYDVHRSILRLSLDHQQNAFQTFQVDVYAPFWIVNRCGLPIELGQKWTASNVTVIGGQPSLVATPDKGRGPTHEREGEASAGNEESMRLAVAGECVQTDGGEVSMQEVLGGTKVSPMPFSFHWKMDVGGSKATVRLGAPYLRYSARDGMLVPCDWSSAFSLESIGGDRALTLMADGFSVDIIVRVQLGDGLLTRTRIVTLLPRYVVCNQLRQPIEVRQVGAESTQHLHLSPGEMHVLKWADESTKRLVSLRLLPDTSRGHDTAGWQWSGPLSVETVGYSPIKVRAERRSAGEDLLAANLMIHTAMQGPVTLLTIHEQQDKPALQVHNCSSLVTAHFRQAGVARELEEKATAGGSTPYCWDFPHAPPILHMRYEVEGELVATREYNLDRFGAFPPLVLVVPANLLGDTVAGDTGNASPFTARQHEPLGMLLVSIIARGPTKVLLIQDAKLDAEEGKPSDADRLSGKPSSFSCATKSHASEAVEANPLAPSSGQTGGDRGEAMAITSQSYTLNIAGLGISIIDATPEELIYVSALQIRAKAVLAGVWHLGEISLGNFQVVSPSHRVVETPPIRFPV
jgi:hypothetical protein